MNALLKGKSVLCALAASLALGAIVGLTMGWTLWSQPTKAIKETHEPAVRNKDKSLVLEKNPTAAAKPTQQVPRGAVVERIVYVEVQPKKSSVEATTTTHGSTVTAPQVEAYSQPSPIRVDLTLYRLGDGSRRIVASSPDGDIVGGLDVPVETTQPAREFKWAVGGVYGRTTTGGRAVGVFIDRDAKFLRAGLEVTKTSYQTPGIVCWEARAKVGIRF